MQAILPIHSWVVYWDQDKSQSSVARYGRFLDEISVFAADFDESYQLTLSPWAKKTIEQLKKSASGGRPRVLLTAVNDVRSSAGPILKDPSCIHEIVSSPERRAAHIEQLMELSRDADGVEIDYESLWLTSRDSFSAFIKELAERLHSENKWLAVAVEPKTKDVLKDKAGAIDWSAIGQYADRVKVMAYFYTSPKGPAGPIAPAHWVVDIAKFGLTQVPPEKLAIVLTVKGYDWPENSRGKAIDHNEALALASLVQSEVRFDRASSSPMFRYKKGDVQHHVWFEDKASLREKVRRLHEVGIQHVGIWRLGSGDSEFWEETFGR